MSRAPQETAPIYKSPLFRVQAEIIDRLRPSQTCRTTGIGLPKREMTDDEWQTHKSMFLKIEDKPPLKFEKGARIMTDEEIEQVMKWHDEVNDVFIEGISETLTKLGDPLEDISPPDS